MQIQLLGAKVLVRGEDKENKTQSGIILPAGKGEEKIRLAEVVEVGNGIRDEDGKRVAMEVKKGDKIIYEHSSYGTKEVEIAGQKYFLVNESDIIGIIK